MSFQSLFIVGCGGLGREILAMVYDINRVNPRWTVEGFYDDNPGSSVVAGVPILGSVDDLVNNSEARNVVLAIGSPGIKAQLSQQLDGKTFPTLIHPNATLLEKTRISIGEGTIVTAGVRITTDVKLGRHVLVNLNTTIGHDCEIEDYVSIMPGVNIAGGITIGQTSLIGSGANLINSVTLGEKSIVGAGSVVLRNVEPGATVVGAPARKLHVND